MTAKIKTMDCSVDGDFGNMFVFVTEIGQVRLTWERGKSATEYVPTETNHVGLHMVELNGETIYSDMEPVNDFAWDKPVAIAGDPELLEKLNISMDEYLACRELAEDALQRFLEEAQEKA